MIRSARVIAFPIRPERHMHVGGLGQSDSLMTEYMNAVGNAAASETGTAPILDTSGVPIQTQEQSSVMSPQSAAQMNAAVANAASALNPLNWIPTWVWIAGGFVLLYYLSKTYRNIRG